MEININNYEEYFLLYADNELTDAEKIEVLKFIRQNKGLEDEFIMIQDTICKPEIHAGLEDKSFLFRHNESSFITEKNYEEVFVLYHDDELTSDQKRQTELFVNEHPHLKNEFDLIRVAKLTSEISIIFPGKENLYKKEKAGRVIPVIFWRGLAAAFFVGFGFWLLQDYNDQRNVLPPITVNLKPAQKNLPLPKKGNGDTQQKNIIAKANKQDGSSIDKKDISNKGKTKQYLKAEKEISPAFVKAKNKKTDIDFLQKISNSDIATVTQIKSIPQKITIRKGGISFSGDTELRPLQSNNDNIQNTIRAHSASYVEDANNKNENYVFYNITTEEFKKSKVGGFLKKVKRIVERNNPVSRILFSDDKQVVSN